jgi:hypothetical protein
MVDAAYKIQVNIESKTECSILKTLAYFDMFNYPLEGPEIRNFAGDETSDAQFNMAMNVLVSSGCIFKLDQFWSLRNDPSLAASRRRGNEKAKQIFPQAFKIGSFLYKFPYVRAVAISGSLSKNFADEKDDIDFFIITKANHLWIARTAMHLFKKLTYLFGKEHSYCMNYYIDETALEIEQRNIYTATEIKTLVPVAGSKTFTAFFEKNDWTKDWLPNFCPAEERIPNPHSFFKRSFEWLFNNRLGERMDSYFFKLTTKRWLKKEGRGKKNIKGSVMNLLTSKHFARSNPEFYQERIIERYHDKLDELKNNWPQFFQH